METFNAKIESANQDGEQIADTAQQVLAMAEDGNVLMNESVSANGSYSSTSDERR